MGRQQTLGKFFEMPPGKKAPAQQSNLSDMWGKKKEPKEDAAKGSTNAKDKKGKAPAASDVDELMDEDVPAPAKPTSKASISKPVKPASHGEARKAKKRPAVEDEDETVDEPGSPSRSHSPLPADGGKVGPPRKRKKQAAEPAKPVAPVEPTSSPVTDATNLDSDSDVEVAPKRLTKRKRRAVQEDEDEDDAVVAPASSSPPPTAAEEEDEEMADEGESEIEQVENKKGATKSAEAALDRRKDVDVKGGWKVGAPVPYAALAKAFSLIEATTKRLEKTSLLCALFVLVIERSAEGDPDSLLKTVYLCINRLCPDYVGIELGIGESLLLKAICESTGRKLAAVKESLKKEGDLGLVAAASKDMQKTLFKPKPLTVPFVFANLKEIATTAGNSSQTKKVSIITKLLAACQGDEAKYIVRSLEGKLRIGNAERTVIVALAHAAVLAEQSRSGKTWSKDKLASRLEEGANIVKSVYSELPTYDEVVPALLKHGVRNLRDTCKLTPGVPLKPMLAKPTKAIGEVLDRFDGRRFTCEYKYDGERAQVHLLPDGSVAVFSRNSEDMSKKYPDLVEQLPHCFKESTKSFVLDAEAVAIDKTTKKLLPFQELSKRKRKDVKIEDIQVRVCLFGFDLLYLNGEPLLHKTLAERRELLREHFKEVDCEFAFAKSMDDEAVEEIQSFLTESVKDGCEGLMVKMLGTDASHYTPSQRSVNWLKIKKDYLAGVGDSLDLVVVGAYIGKGKRTNVYGAFLLACYNSDAEEYQTICKIGTGFSEEALAAHYETLKPLETTKPRGDINVGGAKPDVWFEPKIVWEVLAADLSLSPVYTAAMGLAGERGISLRFPRFIRIRDDKDADDATGSEQVAEMYERQALTQGAGKKKRGGDDDGDDGFW
ncbi:DNA ligase I [Peniophora sp. CONT]|nr:DNA ligase I [Peniophora sp. CONT]